MKRLMAYKKGVFNRTVCVACFPVLCKRSIYCPLKDSGSKHMPGIAFRARVLKWTVYGPFGNRMAYGPNSMVRVVLMARLILLGVVESSQAVAARLLLLNYNRSGRAVASLCSEHRVSDIHLRYLMPQSFVEFAIPVFVLVQAPTVGIGVVLTGKKAPTKQLRSSRTSSPIFVGSVKQRVPKAP